VGAPWGALAEVRNAALVPRLADCSQPPCGPRPPRVPDAIAFRRRVSGRCRAEMANALGCIACHGGMVDGLAAGLVVDGAVVQLGGAQADGRLRCVGGLGRFGGGPRGAWAKCYTQLVSRLPGVGLGASWHLQADRLWRSLRFCGRRSLTSCATAGSRSSGAFLKQAMRGRRSAGRDGLRWRGEGRRLCRSQRMPSPRGAWRNFLHKLICCSMAVDRIQPHGLCRAVNFAQVSARLFMLGNAVMSQQAALAARLLCL